MQTETPTLSIADAFLAWCLHQIEEKKPTGKVEIDLVVDEAIASFHNFLNSPAD